MCWRGDRTDRGVVLRRGDVLGDPARARRSRRHGDRWSCWSTTSIGRSGRCSISCASSWTNVTRRSPAVSSRRELLEEHPEWGGSHGRFSTLTLEPLEAAESARVMQNLLGVADLDAAMVERVTFAADGNPLYLEQMLQMLIDRGAIRNEGGRWVSTEVLTHLEVPPTIAALLTARLIVSADRKNGHRARRGDRTGLLPRSRRGAGPPPLQPEVPHALKALSVKELISPHEESLIGQETFKFLHALIRDAAYGGLLKRTRAELHVGFVDGRSAAAIASSSTRRSAGTTSTGVSDPLRAGRARRRCRDARAARRVVPERRRTPRPGPRRPAGRRQPAPPGGGHAAPWRYPGRGAARRGGRGARRPGRARSGRRGPGVGHRSSDRSRRRARRARCSHRSHASALRNGGRGPGGHAPAHRRGGRRGVRAGGRPHGADPRVASPAPHALDRRTVRSGGVRGHQDDRARAGGGRSDARGRDPPGARHLFDLRSHPGGRSGRSLRAPAGGGRRRPEGRRVDPGVARTPGGHAG